MHTSPYSAVTITALYCYPVKSCKAIRLTEAILTLQGMPYDRQWMVVDENNKFVTQRQNTKLALIDIAMTEKGLELNAPNMPATFVSYERPTGGHISTDVFDEPCETIDEGVEISLWLTKALESDKPLRLVRMAEHFQRQQTWSDLDDETGVNINHVHFADAAPYLLANEASLSELNKQLIISGEQPVPMNRFRPNIVVKGLPAFQEHKLAILEYKETKLCLKVPCERCIVTTIDQQTAVRDANMQPFKMLKTINGTDDDKSNPMFGQYAVLGDSCKTMLSVGDTFKAV